MFHRHDIIPKFYTARFSGEIFFTVNFPEFQHKHRIVSGEIYTAGKNFAISPAVTGGTNLTSAAEVYMLLESCAISTEKALDFLKPLFYTRLSKYLSLATLQNNCITLFPSLSLGFHRRLQVQKLTCLTSQFFSIKSKKKVKTEKLRECFHWVSRELGIGLLLCQCQPLDSTSDLQSLYHV